MNSNQVFIVIDIFWIICDHICSTLILVSGTGIYQELYHLYDFKKYLSPEV